MRTSSLGDPASWRAWDGAAFTVRMDSPYERTGTRRACTFVSPDALGGISQSVTWNTYLKRYVAVGVSQQQDASTNGRRVCGWFFSTSDDLVHWTPRQLLREAPVGFGGTCGAGGTAGTEMYLSLIDPEDTTDNFERSGQSAYIYFVRYNKTYSLDRDLLRASVRFQLR